LFPFPFHGAAFHIGTPGFIWILWISESPPDPLGNFHVSAVVEQNFLTAIAFDDGYLLTRVTAFEINYLSFNRY